MSPHRLMSLIRRDAAVAQVSPDGEDLLFQVANFVLSGGSLYDCPQVLWVDAERSGEGDHLVEPDGPLAGLELGNRRLMQAQLAAAAPFTDPNLLAEGLGARRQDLAARAREAGAAQLAKLSASIEEDARMLANWAEAARPRVGDDAASLMASQMKWDQVRMRLEAGMQLRQVLKHADRDTALAVREWAPAWSDAHAHTSRSPGVGGADWAPPDTTGLMRSVDERLAAVEGGAVAEAFAVARDARVLTAEAGPLVGHLGASIAGRRATH